MNNLEVFKNEKFGEVRTVKIDNEPWFVAKDVCTALDIKNPTDTIKRLDDDEVTRFNLGGLSGETNIVNEYGLYSLVLGSRKKEAKEFKRWITHEVIPAIRKHGAYIVPEMSKELKAILALDQKQMNTDKRIDKLENDIPLYNVSCKEIQSLVRRIGVNALGGKDSPAYKNKSIRTLVYSDIQRQLRREFDVGRYEAIKQYQFDKAKEVINNYRLPMALAGKIEICNKG